MLTAFPLESWRTSAAVNLRQAGGWVDPRRGPGHPDPDGRRSRPEARRQRALRSLSLDQGTPQPGRTSEGAIPVIAELQRTYDWIRSGLFLTVGCTAAATVRHRAAHLHAAGRSRERPSLGEEYGDRIDFRAADGRSTRSRVPGSGFTWRPPEVKGISAEKVKRLHGLARAALDGELDTGSAAEPAPDEALTRLEALPGVGPWTAQGILMRGCGMPDTIPTEDAISRGGSAPVLQIEAFERAMAGDLGRSGARSGCGPRSCCTWPGAGNNGRSQPPAVKFF